MISLILDADIMRLFIVSSRIRVYRPIIWSQTRAGTPHVPSRSAIRHHAHARMQDTIDPLVRRCHIYSPGHCHIQRC
jgi:hypothetical protein